MATEDGSMVLTVKSPKMPNGQVETSEDMTIFDLKNVIHLTLYEEIDIDCMRLVHKGKILSDDDQTLSENNIQNGGTIIVVKVKPPVTNENNASPTETTSKPSSGTSQNNEPISDLFNNLFSSMNNGGTQAAAGGMAGLAGLAGLLGQLNGNQGSRTTSTESNAPGFDITSMLPMAMSFLTSMKSQVNVQNLANLLSNPVVQNMINTLQNLPSHVTRKLHTVYNENEQVQSFVTLVLNTLRNIQESSTSNPVVVVLSGKVVALIESIINFSEEARENITGSNSNFNGLAFLSGVSTLLATSGMAAQNPQMGIALAALRGLMGGNNNNNNNSNNRNNSAPQDMAMDSEASAEMDLDIILDDILNGVPPPQEEEDGLDLD